MINKTLFELKLFGSYFQKQQKYNFRFGKKKINRKISKPTIDIGKNNISQGFELSYEHVSTQYVSFRLLEQITSFSNFKNEIFTVSHYY